MFHLTLHLPVGLMLSPDQTLRVLHTGNEKGKINQLFQVHQFSNFSDLLELLLAFNGLIFFFFVKILLGILYIWAEWFFSQVFKNLPHQGANTLKMTRKRGCGFKKILTLQKKREKKSINKWIISQRSKGNYENKCLADVLDWPQTALCSNIVERQTFLPGSQGSRYIRCSYVDHLWHDHWWLLG